MADDLYTLKSFLKLKSIQEYLQDNDLESVYLLWRRQGGSNQLLTTFFLQNDINPLEYMSYIVDGMFKGIAFINSIDLSDTQIEQIDSLAFEDCLMLKDINLGNVKYIGIGAFSGCSSLYNITFPPSVDSIDEEAFSYSGLISIHIPNTVKRIGLKAFSHNKELIKVTTDHTKEEFIKVCCGDDVLKHTFGNCTWLHKIICSDGELEV